MKIPVKPPKIDEVIKRLMLSDKQDAFYNNMNPLDAKGRYLHWKDLRYKMPPDGLSPEEYWAAIKTGRRATYRYLPFLDKKEKVFAFGAPDNVQEMLHEIDKLAGGNIVMDRAVPNAHTRKYFMITSFFEEAVRSSQLEGATTTRRRAKEMIRADEEPQDRSERMILNNYRAMEFIRQRAEDPLTPELIFELHRILMEGTLDVPEKAGIFRATTDDVHVMNRDFSNVLHTPPVAAELPERMERLCAFANRLTDATGTTFAHPVIRAVILHFMIGYDHPFVDGNGRTARALFYWFMAKSGYWMTEFLSISSVIKEKPGAYGMAYLHTETDDNDMTYFIIHQLEVILAAIDRLEEHIRQKMMEKETVEDLLEDLMMNPEIEEGFTSRHLSLLRHAFKNPGATYTIAEYQKYNNVSYQTARTDLLFLADTMRLFRKEKWRRTYVFTAPMNLRARIEKLKSKGFGS